ncbi:MAG TPA: dipeptide epimerase [Gemmatimonadales bacterium]|nr:dipeptide epimerase [Gemmatimonadales bacterium]
MSQQLRMEIEVLELRTKHPFIIARGGQSDYRTVWVRLKDGDGNEGWGEAAPTKFYGETTETVLAALDTYGAHLPDDPFDLEEAERRWEELLHRNPAARAALSSALHDLVGKRLGVPLYRLWGLDPTKAPRSTFTIGIDQPEKMRAKVREAEQYPILKIKLGTDRDVEILRTIRDTTDREIRVDANCGWTLKQTVRMLPVLEEFGVTVLEQPLPAEQLDGLGEVRRRADIPVIADESCETAADIPPLVGKVDGINIKLAKCGSLREAIRMIAIARAHGMTVMVGCMIESSIGITAAAHFTPLVDIVDLDGAALLADDPFVGATIDGGQVSLPAGPGLGVRRR